VSVGLVTVLFFGLAMGLFVLPFVPALREIRLRRDAAPLPVAPDSQVDVSYFARRFREFVRGHLELRSAGVQQVSSAAVRIESPHEIFMIVPPVAAADELPINVRSARVDQVLLGMGDLHLRDGQRFLREIYASGSVHSGQRSSFRAILAERGLELGRGTQTLRWAHAEGPLRASAGCRLFGRSSSEESIELIAPCYFERLGAPRIEFGPSPPATFTPDSEPPAPFELQAEDLPGYLEREGGRVLVRGDVEIPDGAILDAHLVVWGALRVGAQAQLRGSVKSRGPLQLGPGCVVEGTLISDHALELAEGCRITGPVLADRTAVLAAGCVLGAVQRPTTLRAPRLSVRAGCVIHGSAWALSGGQVLP
jgi:hypothetical protein